MFISTPEELRAFCDRASSSKVLAVDTEFLRERTYHPRLCLIQLATSPDDIAAVDPLVLEDLSPVAELFRNPSIVKVIHACSQDLEVIDGTLGCVPEPMFDTQLAAAFLGHRMQLGYGALVESYTGVHLAKAESLTDWSRRPLDPEQLTYAEDDVRYLPGIYERMIDELVRADRLNWVLPEMQALLEPSHYRHEPTEAFRHLKRSSQLTRKQLAVAREVCAWRERTASKRNIPRKWVLSDEVVLEICKRGPADDGRLRRIRGTEQLSERDGEAVLHAVGRGLSCPNSELPGALRHVRPTGEQESVLDLMYAMLRIISEHSGIAAQLIATRDDLLELMVGAKGSALTQGWRAKLAGEPLRGLLSGACGLTVKDGRVEIL
ncbi:ribonuclease D [Olsenella uli]|uniref:ribonuclease D n=1 Tax=Olsenella uli TaxID=133926 RepID=UPI0012ABD4E8|nr:ribonuclease D [Olsenella uli]